jgi:hypothetical protein
MNRQRLPNRRMTVTIKFEHARGPGDAPRKYIASFSQFVDGPALGQPGEIFINTEQKAGSEADINASDAAVAVSLALQYGCPIGVLREALKRNPDGSPMGPLAAALDIIAEEYHDA